MSIFLLAVFHIVRKCRVELPLIAQLFVKALQIAVFIVADLRDIARTICKQRGFPHGAVCQIVLAGYDRARFQIANLCNLTMSVVDILIVRLGVVVIRHTGYALESIIAVCDNAAVSIVHLLRRSVGMVDRLG